MEGPIPHDDGTGNRLTRAGIDDASTVDMRSSSDRHSGEHGRKKNQRHDVPTRHMPFGVSGIVRTSGDSPPASLLPPDREALGAPGLALQLSVATSIL